MIVKDVIAKHLGNNHPDEDCIIEAMHEYAEGYYEWRRQQEFWDKLGERLKIKTDVKQVSAEEMKTLDEEFKDVTPRCFTVNKTIELCPTQQ